MKSAVGSTGLHPRTTAYCNSDGRFAQIASWQYCSMAWPTLLDCRLRELRRNHCATAGQAQTRQHENGVLLIGPFDFGRVRELVFQTDLSNRGAPRQISLSKLFANSIATFAFISARSAHIRRYFWN